MYFSFLWTIRPSSSSSTYYCHQEMSNYAHTMFAQQQQSLTMHKAFEIVTMLALINAIYVQALHSNHQFSKNFSKYFFLSQFLFFSVSFWAFN